MLTPPKTVSVLCCLVSLAIIRDCSHFPFVSIIASFQGLISKEERAVGHSPEIWLLGPLVGSPFWGLALQ